MARRAAPSARAGLLRRRQLGAEVEQIVLYARQHGVERRLGGGGEAGDADGGIGLVDRAIGFDAQIVLAPPLAGGERGGAGIAAARVDFVETHHRS